MTRTTVRDMIKTSEGGVDMKEILKSKVMVLFIIMVLGLTYAFSITQKFEDEQSSTYQNLVTMNQN